MTVPARLLSVRLQGFKSFAGRTVVEFGPGISAVVGPNGVGKSNLVDALRWTLGEQGRALRSRRSEDVIFAGSEVRPALGMADVTVTLENADGLLALDFSVVELGRRLFRSGENEYLLNGTRVRLRDLEELLDAAHLADNAFLFIGQGMVDQALALRPEERRPLFDEVAGVRRHERRKRAAQERMIESEANLARVRDVIAELRPQARRLAGQAQQQAARLVAGTALAGGVVAASRAAWWSAAQALSDARGRRARGQAEVDAAMADLRVAEDLAVELRQAIDGQLRRARDARAALEGATAALQDARVQDARVSARRAVLDQQRERLEREAASVDERIAEARRRVALPEPIAPGDAQEGFDASRAGGTGRRPGGGTRGDARDRAQAARDRLAAQRRSLAGEEQAHEQAIRQEAEARDALQAATDRAQRARDSFAAAQGAADEQRRVVAVARGQKAAIDERVRAAMADLERLTERGATLDERLRLPEEALPEGAEPVIARLVVEERLRGAVEAALGVVAAAAMATSDEVQAGARRDVVFVLRDVAGPAPDPSDGAIARDEAAREGGGRLGDAVSADPDGIGRRLLARALWVPDLPAALRVAPHLPGGWVVATLTGDRIDSTGVLDAPGESRLALHEERRGLGAEIPAAEAAAARGETDAASAAAVLAEAEATAASLERAAGVAGSESRAATEAEAAAIRRHEPAAREAAWSRAQLDRLRAELARLEAIAAEEPDADRRADLAVAWAAYEASVRERRRLEGQLASDLERSEGLAADLAAAVTAVRDTDSEREQMAASLAELETRVGDRAATVAAADLDEGGVRERLDDAEQARRVARERLDGAEGRARAGEIEELESRMALDGVRERLLVELAGLGAAGLRALGAEAGPSVTADEHSGEHLEAALDGLASEWSTAPPAAAPPPAARVDALRRRYHELGAVNPFAAEEHAEVSERLAALEAQRDDLERAIAATRRLIGELEQLIVAQFQATFRALEAAFERRFGQLFGGGQARLSLTDPADPAASGVEIVARPPGKKTQPLAMLSGGERALTAVALLFAMLEVRPVPFCVLDEVDAALDEANIGRFALALRELAAGIQFIVITHNRGTIEEADALYGVTIGDDAVSRVISLRLEGRGARATAARRAAVPVESA